MPTLKNLDIVYLVKNSEYNGELRYSLRSVCKNFPHRKIWFVGGLPKGIKPDYYQPVIQTNGYGPNDKYENVTKLRNAILQNKCISNNFVLFNDDFFVLNPVKTLPMYVNGELDDLIEFVKEEGNVLNSKYINILKKMIVDLKNQILPTINFECHVPMKINKNYMKTVTEKYGVFRRSLYGNELYDIEECEQIKDVKIYSMIQIPKENQTFVSTTDASFNLGEVGKYIRNKFPEPCEYEYE